MKKSMLVEILADSKVVMVKVVAIDKHFNSKLTVKQYLVNKEVIVGNNIRRIYGKVLDSKKDNFYWIGRRDELGNVMITLRA